MAQTAKAPRENRTITVDFQDPSTYFCLFAQSISSIENFKLLVKRHLQPQPSQDILLHR
jgi:hypothetical protein